MLKTFARTTLLVKVVLTTKDIAVCALLDSKVDTVTKVKSKMWFINNYKTARLMEADFIAYANLSFCSENCRRAYFSPSFKCYTISKQTITPSYFQGACGLLSLLFFKYSLQKHGTKRYK